MPNLTGDPATHTSESLEQGMTGSCLCNAITVKITQAGLFDKPNGHTCHCANCRKFSGTASANVLALPLENIEVSDPKGYRKIYEDTNTGSRDTVPRSFCSNCGSSIGTISSKGSGAKMAFVSLGIFPKIPEPEFELFTAHRHDWVKAVDGAAQHDYLRRPYKD